MDDRLRHAEPKGAGGVVAARYPGLHLIGEEEDLLGIAQELEPFTGWPDSAAAAFEQGMADCLLKRRDAG
jgi:hypothetical protein